MACFWGKHHLFQGCVFWHILVSTATLNDCNDTQPYNIICTSLFLRFTFPTHLAQRLRQAGIISCSLQAFFLHFFGVLREFCE